MHAYMGCNPEMNASTFESMLAIKMFVIKMNKGIWF